MRVFFNRERLESSLIEVPGPRGVMTGVPSHCVGVSQPSEKARHLVVGKRSNDKVPVVWHQAVGKNRKRFMPQGLHQHFRECFIIPRVLEQREPGNPAIEHVVAETCGAESRSARHFDPQLLGTGARTKIASKRVYARTYIDATVPVPFSEKSCVPFLAPEENLKLHCPEIDQPIAALLEDLARRGLLDSTLVVWGGELRRMPVSETFNTGGKPGGRDHNPKGFTYWLAGAGVRGGTSYGATDETRLHWGTDQASYNLESAS